MLWLVLPLLTKNKTTLPDLASMELGSNLNSVMTTSIANHYSVNTSDASVAAPRKFFGLA